MTYWMVLYHTKKTNRKSNCKKQWLVLVKRRDLTILAYKYIQTTWIVACFIANIVIICKYYHGKPFPDPNNFDDVEQSVLGYLQIYNVDCYYSICIRIFTSLLIITAMFYYILARRRAESYGLQHKHKPPTFCSHLPILIACLLSITGIIVITAGWLNKWDASDALGAYTIDQITLTATLFIFLFTYGKMAHYYTKKSFYLDSQSEENKSSLQDNIYFEHEFGNEDSNGSSSFIYVVKSPSRNSSS